MAARIISTTPLLLCIICVARAVALESSAAAVNSTNSAPVTGNITTTTEGAATAITSTNAPPNTYQAPRLVHADESTARAQTADEGRAVTPVGTNDLDGRSAYINNQYVPDGETLPYNDTAPPLYQLLQEQMEHIIATSMPSEYRLDDNAVTSDTTANGAIGKEMSGYGAPALQTNANSPVFAYGATNFEEDDDMIGPYRKGEAEKYYHGTAGTKPSTMELPKPMIMGSASKVHSGGTRPKLPSRAATKTTTTTSTTAAPLHLTGGYGVQLPQPSSATTTTTQQFKPHVVSSGYGAAMPSYKPQIKEEYFAAPNKYSYVHQNSTVHMRKRRITFKTVASASQIISTPLADLMFKYSIGVAKPSMSAGGSSLYEQEEEPMQNSISTGYNDNLHLPKRTYAGKISHSSHRKN
ncbi:uncharacterized protein LOC118740096 [Rhagoletis pomonella]|uniref:uncharacterized protein LOC118740096 n=1 Tax=Rhagoletis pomonella TaxID=28610 RepID=UPI00177A7CC2|nr:uncharacterized protein LOC118740096 [Rhagoletis pomonella]